MRAEFTSTSRETTLVDVNDYTTLLPPRAT
jgi:hypothetical protein